MIEIMIAGAVVIMLKAQVMQVGVTEADVGLMHALTDLIPIFTGTDITASLICMWR